MKTTTRKFDAQYENEVSKFMDNYFYAKLPLSAKRITDKELQILGVDV